MTEPQMEIVTCNYCKCEFERQITDYAMFGEEIIRLLRISATCNACYAKHEAEAAQERRAQRVQEWVEKTIPPIYRGTRLDHPGLSQEAVRIVTEWNFRTGIGFIGDTGRGKSRLLYHALLRGMEEKGLYGRAISHNGFSVLAQDAFFGDQKGDARKRLKSIAESPVLLIDDLGKAPRTERADAEFEEMIEFRVSEELPTLWSANAGGKWLEARFGEDRGPALIRRLAQFCTCLTLR